jgi:hypothetical protein
MKINETVPFHDYLEEQKYIPIGNVSLLNSECTQFRQYLFINWSVYTTTFQIEPQQRDNTSTTNGELCTYTKSITNTSSNKISRK